MDYGLVMSWDSGTQEIKLIDSGPLYQGSVAVHRLKLLTPTTVDQIVKCTFGIYLNSPAEFVPITEPVNMGRISAEELTCPIPDLVLKNSGTYIIAFALMSPIYSEPVTYKVLNTGIIQVNVNASVAQVAQEPIPQSLADNLQAQINNLADATDTRVSILEAQVDILADSIETMGTEYTTAYNRYELASGGFRLQTISGVKTGIIPTVGGTAVYTQMAGYKGEIAADSLGWIADYQNQDIVGYTFTVTAGTHGQIKDGAGPADLWVSLDTLTAVEYIGYSPIFTKQPNGDIIIRVARPLDLIIRVWNGFGIKGKDGVPGEDTVARHDIAWLIVTNSLEPQEKVPNQLWFQEVFR